MPDESDVTVTGGPAPDPVDPAAETAHQHVNDLIDDLNHGRVTKPDVIRVRDRADRAVKDIDASRGFGFSRGSGRQW